MRGMIATAYHGLAPTRMTRCNTYPFDRPPAERPPSHGLVCGLYGPTQRDGSVIRCQAQAGHDGRHRAYENGSEILARWRTAFRPVRDLDGLVVVTLPPEDYRANLRPMFYAANWKWIARVEQLLDQYAWIPFLEQLDDDVDVTNLLADEMTVDYVELARQRSQPARRRAKNLWGPGANAPDEDLDEDEPDANDRPPPIASIERVDQLGQLDADTCPELAPELDRLPSDACLEIWTHDGHAHACHRADDHQDMGTDRLAKLEPHHQTAPHRCRCWCGTVTRSTTYGPLEATSRPEHPLTTDPEDPP